MAQAAKVTPPVSAPTASPIALGQPLSNSFLLSPGSYSYLSVSILPGQFYDPAGVAVDRWFNVYVADTQNHKIQKITEAGVVTTLAGTGVAGYADGAGTAAQFNLPTGVAVDSNGNVYVAEAGNNCIRKVSPAGVVSLVVSGGGGNAVWGVAVDSLGDLYISADSGAIFRYLQQSGSIETAADASGMAPRGVAVDSSGKIYFTDTTSSIIRTADGAIYAGSGFTDQATGQDEYFSTPSGLAADSSGNLYVADSGSGRIRKVTPNNQVSTLVGNVASAIFEADSSMVPALSFPYAVAVDSKDNLYVTDSGNNRILKVTPSSVAGTWAFASPSAVLGAGTSTQTVVFTPIDTAKYNTVTASVSVTVSESAPTLSWTPNPTTPLIYPAPLTPTQLNATSSVDGTFSYNPTNGAVLPAGTNRLVATFTPTDTNQYTSGCVITNTVVVSKGTPLLTWTPSPTAGLTYPAPLTSTQLNATSSVTGTFSYNPPNGTVLPAGTNTLVATFTPTDTNNYTSGGLITNTVVVVKGTPSFSSLSASSIAYGQTLAEIILTGENARVSTLAGSGIQGFADGTGTAAQFYKTEGVALDSLGNVYLADSYNNRIRKVTPSGVVTTFAGSGISGYADGTGTAAQFSYPQGVAVDSLGNVYVVDSIRIRKVTPEGLVSTLAGSTSGYADGAGTVAKFNAPTGVAVDSLFNVYVVDSNRIRKVTPAGVVTTLAGTGIAGYADGAGTVAKFNAPIGVAVDSSGNVYVVDKWNHRIRKVTRVGEVTTLAGSGAAGYADGAGATAKFNYPQGVAVDSSGILYVGDASNNRIRKVTPEGLVSTLAGSTSGYADGAGATAKFNYPQGVAVDSSGNVYVADASNNRIRKVTTVLGVWAFAAPSTVLNGGTSSQTVVFTPTDANYNTVTTSVSITVTAVVPTLTWTPSPMAGLTYPAPLTPTQLNATSSVAGTFIYNPANGSVLPVGTNTLVATFTPSNTNNYSSGGTITNTVVVSKGTPPLTWTPSPTAGLTYPNPLTSTQLNASSSVAGTFSYNPPSGTVLYPGTNALVATFTPSDTNNYASGGLITNTVVVSKGVPPLTWTPTPTVGLTYPAALSTNQLNATSSVSGTFSYNPTNGTVLNTGTNELVATFMPEDTNNYSSGGVITNTVVVTKGTPLLTWAPSPTAGLIYPAPLTSTQLNATSSVEGTFSYNPTSGTVLPAGTNTLVTTFTPTDTNNYSSGGGITNTVVVAKGILQIDNTPIAAVIISGQTLEVTALTGRDWVVTTLAGSGVAGSANGFGTAAQFNRPNGVARDTWGNVYVAEQDNHRIRKITAAGVVTTLAGGTQGYADGVGTAAQFEYPSGVAVDSSGNVYVADQGNDRIRKVTPAGVVTTLAGGLMPGYTDGVGTAAQFYRPTGVAVDSSGNVYVADCYNNRIRKVTPAGVVSTLAGKTSSGSNFGYVDGIGTGAQFANPIGVAVDSSGNVYVADTMNNRIRKVTPAGVVSTLAGSTKGYADGVGTAAQFDLPYGVTVDSSGNIYVADTDNQRIRKVTAEGVVITLAGGTQGYLDGTGTAAQFDSPTSMVLDSLGNVYVADLGNNRIRKITPTASTPTAFSSRSLFSVRTVSASSGLGTWSFLTPEVVPNIGTSSQSVVFTPTDSSYNSVISSVMVTVLGQMTPDEWLAGTGMLTSELLLKYAVGGAASPTAPSENASGVVDDYRLSLTAVVRIGDQNLIVVGEAGSDLVGLSSDNVVMVPSPDQTNLPNGFQRQEFSVDISNSPARQFMRLRIIR